MKRDILTIATIVLICMSVILAGIIANKLPTVSQDIEQETTMTIEESTEPIIDPSEYFVEQITEPITIATEPITEPTEPTTIATEPQVWWTEDELDMLAALIFYEAGCDECTDRHQQLVGQVVLNRVADDRYPDTIYGVITDTKYGVQYQPYKLVLKNMGNRDIIPQRCYDNALVVLNGEVDCPPNVIYQAAFKQGSGIYEQYHLSYETTYFCYG